MPVILFYTSLKKSFEVSIHFYTMHCCGKLSFLTLIIGYYGEQQCTSEKLVGKGFSHFLRIRFNSGGDSLLRWKKRVDIFRNSRLRASCCCYAIASWHGIREARGIGRRDIAGKLWRRWTVGSYLAGFIDSSLN
jgi:hypothetical protein